MLESILRTCAARRYDLLTAFLQLSSDGHMDYEDGRKAYGIILLGYGYYELYRARLEQLNRQGTHFVRWGAVDGESIGATIGCDNVAGGRDAAQHLIAHGRTRIAFLGDVSGHYPELRDRYRGLCEVQAQHGLPVDPAFQVDALTIEDSGYEAARRLPERDLAVYPIFAGSGKIGRAAGREKGCLYV